MMTIKAAVTGIINIETWTEIVYLNLQLVQWRGTYQSQM